MKGTELASSKDGLRKVQNSVTECFQDWLFGTSRCKSDEGKCLSGIRWASLRTSSPILPVVQRSSYERSVNEDDRDDRPPQ
jgi:hypothetical protein